MRPILKIENLDVEFKRKQDKIYALRDVSFEIFPNEITAVVGESGCGKSALAKSIVKLLPDNANIANGSILCNDKSLLDMSEIDLKKIRGKEIGMVFQDPHLALNPTMKIGRQICEALIVHKVSSLKNLNEACYQILEKVNIKNPKLCFDLYPHQISGGMKQRILIAIAVACKPKLLIADEPTTALDATIQLQILKLLKTLQVSYGMSILLVTHDMAVVASLCSKMIVMYAGEIVEMGETKKIIESPQHPYTKMLLDSVPTLDKHKRFNRLKPINGYLPTINSPISHCSFLQRCPYAMQICAEKKPLLTKNKQNTRCWLCNKNEKQTDRSQVLEEIFQAR